MRKRYFYNFVLCVTFMVAGSVFVTAQTVTKLGPGGISNQGVIETAINGDDATMEDGTHRIYELERGQVYIMNKGLSVNNPGGSITIRAEEGNGPKPVIGLFPLNNINVTPNAITGSVTLQNIQINIVPTNMAWLGLNWMTIDGEGSDLTVEGCLIENTEGSNGSFLMADATANCNVIMRNNYFRDFNKNAHWWQGRVLDCRSPMDTLIFENNTVTGGGLTLCIAGALVDFMNFSHNTIINNHRYVILNTYYKEYYNTNNLYVNANFPGEDWATASGQDSDGQLFGTVNIDTITFGKMTIPDRYLNAGKTAVTEDIDGLDDIIFYAADNVFVNSPTLDGYYNGTNPNDGITGAPASYSTGNTPYYDHASPYEVYNVPGQFMNERTTQLVADHANLKEENNSDYSMTVAELGLRTDPMPQTMADAYVNFIRFLFKVEVGGTAIAKPTTAEFASTHFGDADPNTIVGVETEESAAGGITLFSDIPEDFSYTANLESKSDGLPIGALHWDDNTYDYAASLASIKSVYDGGAILPVEVVSLIPVSVKQNITRDYALKAYPNPARVQAYISFNLPNSTFVNLSVYDLTGKLVKTLLNEKRDEGLNEIEFTPKTSGSLYIYRLTTNEYTVSGKISFLK